MRKEFVGRFLKRAALAGGVLAAASLVEEQAGLRVDQTGVSYSSSVHCPTGEAYPTQRYIVEFPVWQTSTANNSPLTEEQKCALITKESKNIKKIQEAIPLFMFYKGQQFDIMDPLEPRDLQGHRNGVLNIREVEKSRVSLEYVSDSDTNNTFIMILSPNEPIDLILGKESIDNPYGRVADLIYSGSLGNLLEMDSAKPHIGEIRKLSQDNSSR